MHSLTLLSRLNGPYYDDDVVTQHALAILERRVRELGLFLCCPGDPAVYVRLKLAEYPDLEHFFLSCSSTEGGWL
jgi:hypothetical protein